MQQYWLFSPGEQAKHWDADFQEDVMSLGWDAGDLAALDSEDSIQRALQQRSTEDGGYTKAKKMLWQFSREMHPGDVVYARKGNREIIARGVVTGEYVYHTNRGLYPNVRGVEWQDDGHWYVGNLLTDSLHSGNQLRILYNITYKPELTDTLNEVVGRRSDLPSAEDADAGSSAGEPAASQRSYWLHRMYNHERNASIRMLQAGYLAIGWRRLSSSGIESIVDLTQEQLVDALAKNGYRVDRGRFDLGRFLKIRKGDFVIVPFPGEFSVYEVTGSPQPVSAADLSKLNKDAQDEPMGLDETGHMLQYENGTPIDFGFIVQVKPVKQFLNRKEYADARLYSRMKARQTTLDISALAPSVDRVIAGFEPVDLESALDAAARKSVLEGLRTTLHDKELERVVAWYMKKTGATRVSFPPSRGKTKQEGADIDVVAEFEPLNVTVLIQVKAHTTGKTSDGGVKQAANYETTEAYSDSEVLRWVISTADDFTDDAKALAVENGIRLIDGPEFASRLLAAGLSGLSECLES